MPMEEITMSGPAAMVLKHQVRRFETVLADEGWEQQELVDAAHEVHENLIQLLVAQDKDGLDHALGEPASWRFRQTLFQKVMEPVWQQRKEDQQADLAAEGLPRDLISYGDDMLGLMDEDDEWRQQHRERLRQMSVEDLQRWAEDDKTHAAAVHLGLADPTTPTFKTKEILPTT